jgi:hypothetical protein
MRSIVKSVLCYSASVMLAAVAAAGVQDEHESPPAATSTDPRVGLKAGFRDAGEAVYNLELVVALPAGRLLRSQSTRGRAPAAGEGARGGRGGGEGRAEKGGPGRRRQEVELSELRELGPRVQRRSALRRQFPRVQYLQHRGPDDAQAHGLRGVPRRPG